MLGESSRFRAVSARRVTELEDRVSALEADLAEARRNNLRLAELIDVVQELLVPMADRDERKLREVIAKFADEL